MKSKERYSLYQKRKINKKIPQKNIWYNRTHEWEMDGYYIYILK